MAERDFHQHGDVFVETVRTAPDTIEVRIFQGLTLVRVVPVREADIRDVSAAA